MRFKGFKPIKLTGEPGPTVGDGHQDRRASDRNAALKTQGCKTVGLFATFTRGHGPPSSFLGWICGCCWAAGSPGSFIILEKVSASGLPPPGFPRKRRPWRRPGSQQTRCAYSITSSASASRDDGTLMRSAFAVLRLMTSSNLVGSWIGRSPGFSPLSTRAT
jgi:hypothetical protein